MTSCPFKPAGLLTDREEKQKQNKKNTCWTDLHISRRVKVNTCRTFSPCITVKRHQPSTVHSVAPCAVLPQFELRMSGFPTGNWSQKVHHVPLQSRAFPHQRGWSVGMKMCRHDSFHSDAFERKSYIFKYDMINESAWPVMSCDHPNMRSDSTIVVFFFLNLLMVNKSV